VYLQGWCSNLDLAWDSPFLASFLRGLATGARLIPPDRRGWGCSDRLSPTDVPPFETMTEIEIRAGVHTGEVETIDNEVGGLSVVIGARIAAKAGPSEVLVSQTVKDLVAGSGLSFESAGERELKGVPDRWHIYRVVEG